MQSARYVHSIARGLGTIVGPGAIALKIREQITGRDLSHKEGDVERIRGKLRGHFPETAKPTHIALIAASMAIFGDNDYCGNVVSAILGTLTIAVVFLLGRRMGGTSLGLISSFLLAISPLHLIYSREALAEADSIFFFYCAFYLWYLARKNIRHRTLFLLLSGVGAGLSFTCNDRWIIIPFVFLSLEITALFFKKERRTRLFLGNCSLLAAGFLLPVIVWESVYFILKNRLGLIPLDYFDQLWARTAFHTGFSIGYGGILPFFLMVARFEGLAITLMLICGLVLICLRRSQADFSLLIVLFFPFALFTFRPHHFLRIFSLAIPSFYLIVGSFLCWMLAGTRKRWALPRPIAQGIVLVLIILAIAPNLSRDSKIIHWRSHYREAIAFLTSQEFPNHFSTVAKLSQYYTDNRFVQRPPREEGVRPGNRAIARFPFLLVNKQRDYQTTFGPSPSDWVQRVEEECIPVFETREGFDKLFFAHFAFEHNVDYWETSAFLQQLNVGETSMLRIYRLQHFK